ncbi:MAG: NADH-quinone oxidoreductase subunit C [Promethearchaeia archaeon]
MIQKEEQGEHHPADREGHEREYKILETVINDNPEATIEEDSYVHKQPRRIFLQVKKDKFRKFAKYLKKELNVWQCSTVSGRDLGDNLQACYHFFLRNKRIALTVRVNVPRSNPEYPSITDLFPGFEYVENELREMYGIIPVDLKKKHRVELPEDWPEDEHPLRKDWDDPRGVMERAKRPPVGKREKTIR